MLSSPGNAARPSTLKPPDRCPYCNSPRLIKKGTRKKKLETVPLYRCRSCGRTFAPGPRELRNKTYPLAEILEAFTLYDRGNTLEETAERISSRHGHRVAPSTISRWLSEHPRLTTYRRLRRRGRRLFTPTQVIRAQKLYHRQVYEFAYHRAKLAFLKDGTLDDKRASSAASTARFAPVADFLEAIPTMCPHDLFRREEGARSSQVDLGLIDLARLIVITKQNAATEVASLTLVVWKLDRLGRNLRHLVNIVHDLTARSIGFRVLTGQGASIDTTTPSGKLVFGIFASLAEFERDLISERTRAGLASARARGRKGGRRPKMTAAKVRLAAAAMGKPETNVAYLCEELGISSQTLYRYVSPTGALRPDAKKALGARNIDLLNGS